LRAQEGLQKQAKGNAIERLGKNVIGFRTALLHESIFPFVCFGGGCDFAPDSSLVVYLIAAVSIFVKKNGLSKKWLSLCKRLQKNLYIIIFQNTEKINSNHKK
jgi:hypothetical protein